MDHPRALLPGDVAFAVALYSEATRNGGNTCFAPLSIALSLAMACAGAHDETAAELARALGVPSPDPGQLQKAFGAVMASLKGGPGVDLTVANALFGQSGLGFRSDFLALLTEHYGATLHEVDFRTHTGQARLAINEFVREHTRGVIAEIVPAGSLSALTQLVQVNAIYFKGTWASQFNKNLTSAQPFFLRDGRSSRVLLMHMIGDYKLLQVDEGQILELPYKGGAFSRLLCLLGGGPRTRAYSGQTTRLCL